MFDIGGILILIAVSTLFGFLATRAWKLKNAFLKEYEQGKLQHAFSKREYYRWKDEYLAQIVERL